MYLTRNTPKRHSGEGRNLGQSHNWIPIFIGMTAKFTYQPIKNTWSRRTPQ